MRGIVVFNAVPRAVVLLFVLLLLVSLHVRPRPATGLRVRIASDTCNSTEGLARVFLLHVPSKGGLWFGPAPYSEPVEQGALAKRLSDVYHTRYNRILYLSGDDNVDFQKVAEAIDTVQHAKETPLEAAGTLKMEIRLVTLGAVNTPCDEDSYNWWKANWKPLPSDNRHGG